MGNRTVYFDHDDGYFCGTGIKYFVKLRHVLSWSRSSADILHVGKRSCLMQNTSEMFTHHMLYTMRIIYIRVFVV